MGAKKLLAETDQVVLVRREMESKRTGWSRSQEREWKREREREREIERNKVRETPSFHAKHYASAVTRSVSHSRPFRLLECSTTRKLDGPVGEGGDTVSGSIANAETMRKTAQCSHKSSSSPISNRQVDGRVVPTPEVKREVYWDYVLRRGQKPLKDTENLMVWRYAHYLSKADKEALFVYKDTREDLSFELCGSCCSDSFSNRIWRIREKRENKRQGVDERINRKGNRKENPEITAP